MYGAPQQGGYPGQGPGHGYGSGYPSAPPKKRNTGLLVSLAIAAVVLIALAIVLPMYVLNKTLLDQGAVQRDVAVQFEDQEGVSVELDCPSDMEVEVSQTYECTGTTADSEDVTLVIEITDENGNYTWQEKQ
jgi:flagellar basal body-associated protein FliL